MKKFSSLLVAFCFPLAAELQAQVPQLINFQGRVAVDGINFNGSGQFKFALVNGDGSATYWNNDGSGVGAQEPALAVTIPVSQGLYSVLLGDATLTNMTPIPATVFTNGDVRLRIWFNDGTNGFEQLSPDQRIAAVGYAMMAANVADGAVTTAKLAQGAVTGPKLAPNAVTAANIVAGSVGAAQLGTNAAADNLRASGGLILSDQPNATNLITAGYIRIGQVTTDVDYWNVIGPVTPSARSGHSAVWTGSEMIVWGGRGAGGLRLNTGLRYDPATDSWTALTTTGAPPARSGHAAVWTGTEMIVWGGANPAVDLNDGGRYDPVSDSWRSLSVSNAPSPRHGFTATWTGSEWIIWGGIAGVNIVNTGARYNPRTDAWTAVSTTSAAAPRYGHSAVWTGRELIVWGGVVANPSSAFLSNSGGRYDPATDSWTSTATGSAPVARAQHVAAWTGNEMIVWGGLGNNGPLVSGGRYSPEAGTWTPTSTTNAPLLTPGTAAVWSGADMIVWNGRLVAGGRYNPASNAWSAVSSNNAPVLRSSSTTVWTDTELIVWGGAAGGQDGVGIPILNTGGRYNPATDAWKSTAAAPAGRVGHTAVWTGNEMIVWGGSPDPTFKTIYPNGGARFNPVTARWVPISTFNAPTPRANHTAVWTGREMIVWGGLGPPAGSIDMRTSGVRNTGGRYDPVRDLWSATETNGAPVARTGHTALWTGDEMIVWGGTTNTSTQPSPGALLNSGGRYLPALNAWISMASSGAPAPRTQHAAAWSGSEMIIWGGLGLNTNNTMSLLGNGARYNPTDNSWKAVSNVGAPRGMISFAAIFAGDELLIGFPGKLNEGSLGPAGRYRPASDSWSSWSRIDAPAVARSLVWTGNEVIVWDGSQVGRYDPVRDVWTRRKLPAGPPPDRTGMTAVWTGNSMLLFGGSQTSTLGTIYPDDVYAYSLSRPMYLYQKP